nr:enoyl-CoA hydratase-related protein [Brevibacillus sp. HB1.4B]
MEVRDFAQLAVSVTSQIESLGKVVVAAINGYALGGGLEIAESCTLRIAVHHAKMGHPEVRIGAVAGFGGTTRLPRLLAVKLTWDSIHRGSNLTVEESALLGADYFGLVASTEDFREGTKAFLDKTPPRFTGR